jgi:hypothetical protein
MACRTILLRIVSRSVATSWRRRRAGDRHRDGQGDRFHEVIRRDETKPDQLLGVVNPERGLATSWASIEVGRDGGRKAQPTAWAATVGHDRPFPFGARETSVLRSLFGIGRLAQRPRVAL